MRDARPDADKSAWEMTRSAGRLFTYIRPWWYVMLAVVALMSIITALRLVRPWLFKVLLDDVWPSGDYRLHALVVGIFAGSMLAGAVAAFLHSYLTQMLGQRIVRSLRNQLYTHLQDLSIRFFEDHPTGETMSRVVNDSEAVEFMLVRSVESIIMSVFTLIGVATMLLIMNAKLAALTLIPIPPIVIAVTVFGRRLHERFSTFREKVADLNTFVQERLSGVRVVKSFAREEQEVEGFESRTRDYYDAFMEAALRFSVFEPLMGLLMGLGTLIVCFFGGRLVLAGELTSGEFMAFILYLATFYRPIERLGRQIGHSLPRSLASADRIFEFLDESPELEVAPDAIAPEQLEGRIELEQVSFGYKDETVLSDISLTVDAGETVALVGPSGVGKTTMVDLICRFYDVQAGRILMDGIDVRQYEPRALRDHIGMVLQEPFLFNATVSENIAYGRPDCHEEDVHRAAAQAGAAGFISELPKGYQTVVGERGVKLSVGQKQRISIARALLKDPAILILDEATSSVDTVTERVIQDALAAAAQGRTTILIAHRLSTTDIADRIVVLDQGRLVEQGTRADLLALGGRFAELWDMQSLDGELPGQPAPPEGHG
jgi:ABC-type multidrug transport system fused ATPase/permease subunit